MKLSKGPLLAGLAAAVVAGTGLFAFSHSAFALQSGNDSLANKIATKFNLNESDVQAVIDQDKSDRQAQMQQKIEDRLNQAVTDGKITSDQKTQILAKMAEVKTKLDALKNETDKTKRHDAMKAIFDDVQQWAKDNNIPTEYLLFGKGGHHGMGAPGMGGMGGPGMMGDHDMMNHDSATDDSMTGGSNQSN